MYVHLSSLRKRSFDTQAGKAGSKHVLCDKSPLREKSQKDTTVGQINYWIDCTLCTVVKGLRNI
jgi:hypothetical protein